MGNSAFLHFNSNNDKTALVEGDHEYSYASMHSLIGRFASGLLIRKPDLSGERIAIFLPASLDFVTSLLGIWRAGGIAVPLNVATATDELDHYLNSAAVTRVITSKDYRASLKNICQSLNIEVSLVAELLESEENRLPTVPLDRRAMILFTSGTTSKPKGVVTTHGNVMEQVSTLIEAWKWTADDSIPLFLPVHHIHGIVNILCCGLAAGATVHLFPKFELATILRQVKGRVFTLFMGVPTIYVKLVQYLEKVDPTEADSICEGFKYMRLNVSGSAACPVSLYNRWKDLTGQVLLERYGMTEIGMAISNPYEGTRRAGYVGVPLPGVDIQLFGEDDQPIREEGVAGEIRVRSKGVFLEYWNNEVATQESFKDGWFRTGDVSVIESGYYRIMGRSSVDIIKSGGYKLSALEIENVLLMHESIKEVAVIGSIDETWGEAVTAVTVLVKGEELELDELRVWCQGRLSSYKIPKFLKIVEKLPRNAMGKVSKPALRSTLQTVGCNRPATPSCASRDQPPR